MNTASFIDKLRRALKAEENMKDTLAEMTCADVQEVLTESVELDYLRQHLRTIQSDLRRHIEIVAGLISDISNGRGK